MAREMLINTAASQECRIAIVADGNLAELYVERTSSASHVGNIYKGKVVNIEPSIQAAFVDFGLTKHGFLHISDLQPQYFPQGKAQPVENVGRKQPHYKRPLIQDCLKRGQELLVQMTKEGIGTKGPTMTTYLSIPGRLLVMMPGMARLGISRKIEDEQARDKARQMLSKLKLPANMGFIVRTAGVGRPARELQRDLNYLLRLWNTVRKHATKVKTPAEIYQESDLVTRTIRDIYGKDITRVICDDSQTARQVLELLNVAMPRTKHKVNVYTGVEGLFHDYGLEREIEKIYARRVSLASGGSLVIDQAEALVAIDINSGRYRGHKDAETSALKINQEAAVEIARQLRLRDLGGVIVIDFIDMRESRNRRAVERSLREAMKEDRAKTKVLRISNFGVIEMTRQRIGPSLRDSICRTCSHCGGSGLIKSEESQALQVIRMLKRATSNEDVSKVSLGVTPAVAHHLSNYQRRQISEIESETGKTIIVSARPDLAGDEIEVKCTNSRGSDVAWHSRPSADAKAGEANILTLEEFESQQANSHEAKANAPQASATQPKAKKPRKRGNRGGRKRRKTTDRDKPTDQSPADPQHDGSAEKQQVAKPEANADSKLVKTKKAKRPRRKSRKKTGSAAKNKAVD